MTSLRPSPSQISLVMARQGDSFAMSNYAFMAIGDVPKLINLDAIDRVIIFDVNNFLCPTKAQ